VGSTVRGARFGHGHGHFSSIWTFSPEPTRTALFTQPSHIRRPQVVPVNAACRFRQEERSALTGSGGRLVGSPGPPYRAWNRKHLRWSGSHALPLAQSHACRPAPECGGRRTGSRTPASGLGNDRHSGSVDNPPTFDPPVCVAGPAKRDPSLHSLWIVSEAVSRLGPNGWYLARNFTIEMVNDEIAHALILATS